MSVFTTVDNNDYEGTFQVFMKLFKDSKNTTVSHNKSFILPLNILHTLGYVTHLKN